VKKILIIGSQGYLGSRLMQYLNKHGYKVGGIDRGTFKSCVLQPYVEEPENIQKDACLVSKDDIQKFDCVINLASNSNDPTSSVNPDEYYQPGVIFTIKIAKMCKELGIKYIFPSSCSVYGSSDSGICYEESITNPITAYSKSKIEIEENLSRIANKDFTPIALRLATVFGYSVRMRFDIVINMFIGMLLTDNRIILNSNGNSWRPHLFIDDAMEAFRCAIEWNVNSGKLEVLNVGCNENNQTILQSALELCKLFPGSTVDYLNDEKDPLIFSDRKILNGKDARNYQVNFDKIYSKLPGFKKKTQLMSGAIELIKTLKSLGLDKKTFLDNKFYRLQYLESHNF
jgi:nucleoside-diphosphate-sugar epimerase